MAIKLQTTYYEYVIVSKRGERFNIHMTKDDANTLSEEMVNMDKSFTLYCPKTGNVKLSIMASEISYVYLKEDK